MAAEVIRIFSDLHYGDRSSRIARLDALAPLAEGADAVIVNGDSLDTRPGPHPAFTANCRAEVQAFFREWGPPVTFLTGNHDPDFSCEHHADLAGGRVFVTHGDVLYPGIVPWGRDAAAIRAQMAAEWQTEAQPVENASLADRFKVLRRVATAIPQRHQSERNRFRYWQHLAADIVWPPWRVPCIFAAWRSFPRLAEAFLRSHRPGAQVMLTGHTHRPGIWRRRSGTVIVNTGSFCRPFGGLAVDIAAGKLQIRAICPRRGEFRLGGTVAELRLASPTR